MNHLKYKSMIISILKTDHFKTKTIYHNLKVQFIKPSIAKLMRDTVGLAITFRRGVHNYLGTSEGSILNIHWLDSFVILI
jgi:hypothetical protein